MEPLSRKPCPVRIVVGSVIGLLCTAAITGCSLLPWEIDQCRTDEHCRNFRSEGPLVCRDRLCVTACERHSDCTEPGHACVDGACRALASEECEVLANGGQNQLRDGNVLLGALLREEVADRSAEREALELAALELNQGEVRRAGRGVLVVGCRAAGDPTDPTSPRARATEHLLHHLRLPGMVVDLQADVAVQLYRMVLGTRDQGPLVIAPGTAVSADPPLPSSKLLWHLGGSRERLLDAYRLVLQHALPLTGAEAEEPRLRILTTAGRAIERATAQALDNHLFLPEYATVTNELARQPDDNDDELQEIRMNRAHVMLALSPEPEAFELMTRAESEIPPIVLLAPELEFGTRLKNSTVMSERLVGLRWAAPRGSQLLAEYVTRLASRYPNSGFVSNAGITYRSSAPGHYDALYLLAYATFAATGPRQAPATGATLARSLQQFIALTDDDTSVMPRAETGPGESGRDFVFEHLRTHPEDPLLVEGVTGVARFRSADGTRLDAPIALWCRSERRWDIEFDGAYVDIEAEKIELVTGACKALAHSPPSSP